MTEPAGRPAADGPAPRRTPLALSLGAIAAVFLMNVAILTYAVTQREPHYKTISAATRTPISARFTGPLSMQQGIEITNSLGCVACHKLKEKLVGPPFEEVAARYPHDENTYEALVAKVIAGGSGNWGTVVMIPHRHLLEADVRAAVGWVLALDKIGAEQTEETGATGAGEGGSGDG